MPSAELCPSNAGVLLCCEWFELPVYECLTLLTFTPRTLLCFRVLRSSTVIFPTPCIDKDVSYTEQQPSHSPPSLPQFKVAVGAATRSIRRQSATL